MKKLILTTFAILTGILVNAQIIRSDDLAVQIMKELFCNGVQILIMSGSSSSNMVYEGFYFVKDTNNTNGKYKVRYLKYFQHEDNAVEILKDTVFYDNNAEQIFIIESLYHDKIFLELSNMEYIMAEKDTDKNGEIIYRTLWHKYGKVRDIGVFYGSIFNSSVSSESIINLNTLHEKAYYYWLLNSAINNYMNDFMLFRLREDNVQITSKKQKKR
jgi:hypothetical protein